MEIVLASNFDDVLVEATADLPVSTFFGNFPVGLTGGGRPPRILPAIDDERFRAHVRAVHGSGRRFNATLNSNDLALQEYRPGFERAFLAEVDHLLDLGVDGFVVALPLLIEILHRAHPEVPISVSSFARIRTVTQGEYFLRLGASILVLEEANRDFALLRGLLRRGATVEILVNQSCLQGCPFRGHHLSTSSIASQPGQPCPVLEYPIAECGWAMVEDPRRLVSAIYVRPEDLAVYEEMGISRFKVSGRNKPTPWLVRAARAYAARSYPGNLLDIVSFVQIRAPLQFLRSRPGPRSPPDPPGVRTLREAYERLGEVSIDNRAFPKGFLRRIAATDCEHTSCDECGYCGAVAQKVLRIGGRPVSEYAPPPHTVPLDLLSGIPSDPPAVPASFTPGMAPSPRAPRP
ncbi:MAG: U32 family peptidase [Thermoplasmata archaeon]